VERSHRHRWITGLALLPPLLYLVHRGGAAFAGFVSLFSILAMSEYLRIAVADKAGRWFGVLSLLAMGAAPLMVWAAHVHSPDFVLLLLFFDLIGCALLALVGYSTRPDILEKVARQVQGVVLIGLPLCAAVLIRDGTDGAAWLFSVLAVVFAGDIGAYYAGTRFGRRKLLPAVSPGKTVEGSMGGLAANLLTGAAAKVFALPALGWGEAFVLFVLIGAAGQVGDLFESAFKRTAGVKDSGTLLPGHGGVLDRIDALLFALPVAYFFKKFVLWV
jgi:phosphatidate cytidylyltransferase